MATFLVLQQELASQVGLDQTVSAQATLLKRWINDSQQQILRAFEWPFNRCVTPMVVQTVTDYTTGTIATVAGSTSVTFSSAPSTSKAGFYLQTSDSKDWYKITAHTAASTSATLEIAAINTNSVATFTVRKIYYSTDATVDRIIAIKQSILPYQLIETAPEFFDAFNPGHLSSGTSRIYMPSGLDANGYPQFQLWPNPDAVLNLSVDYLKVAVDMSADADVSVIPAKWHTTVLLDGAKVKAFGYLDDTRLNDAKMDFLSGIEEMKGEYETGLHRHRVMTATDNQPVGGNLGYMPLPFNYPRNS